MSWRLGQRAVLFESDLWHIGTVVGVRRPPSPGDDRVLVRLSFAHMPELELTAGSLALMAQSPVDRERLCSVCFPGRAPQSSVPTRA